MTFAAHTDANKIASFERFAIVDVNAFAVYRHAVECDERTPPNPREYPYSPGVSATYVSKTKVERNLYRGRKQPRSAYALSRSSTARLVMMIFSHTPRSRAHSALSQGGRAARDISGRPFGSRSTIDRGRCTRLRRRRPESSSVRDVPSRACFVVVVVRRARMHVERERARVFGVVSVRAASSGHVRAFGRSNLSRYSDEVGRTDRLAEVYVAAGQCRRARVHAHAYTCKKK